DDSLALSRCFCCSFFAILPFYLNTSNKAIWQNTGETLWFSGRFHAIVLANWQGVLPFCQQKGTAARRIHAHYCPVEPEGRHRQAHSVPASRGGRRDGPATRCGDRS